ncbi:hypothetical protein M9Y10_034767 [Tritrichomonas musculus]|uniref:Uncharacterized protein n=1 Tax=Tritrichomonas musculus TaxID=1915356 RepID=A0ABR2KGC4_9EUKA
MFCFIIILFFWSDRKSETTSVFESTAAPTNRIENENNEFNYDNNNKFQSSREFSKNNYETFPPMFSERYNTFTEEPTHFSDEQDFEEPPPHQYFFTPFDEYTPTQTYQRDEL